LKRSLVTGAHGFVASHLAKALLERGDSVTSIDSSTRRLSGLMLQGIEDEVEVVRGDLVDTTMMRAVIESGEYDSVFHLAARTIVGPAMADPVGAFDANVRGTWTLLEACRAAEVPAVIVASSDKAYGASDRLPYREDDPLVPGSPYEASKAAADVISRSYWASFRLPVAVTRFANIYGGGDLNFSRLVPEAVCAVIEGRRPVIRSDGSPERDFLYVDDAVAAYLAIEHAVGAGGPAAGEAFNAGGGRPHSVRSVLELIGEVSGTGIQPDIRGSGNPEGEIDRQFVDPDKLIRMTGWSPKVELGDGLERTVEWYRAHPEARPA
jgi:CDP-glucose 4,6-dehydratase